VRVLLLGSGGREHALAWKLKQSKRVDELWVVPGSDAIAEIASCVPGNILDSQAMAALAKEKQIELCVIGPDDPLAAGVADAIRGEGILVFGPDQAAAQLESSKDFAKQFMLRHGVATAGAKTFDEAQPALDYALGRGFPLVVKADGLALGKGVMVCQKAAELEKALDDCFKARLFGDSGNRVLIEDFLEGEEATLLCFCDGKRLVPMAPSQDHKRIFDGDQGPNTGGMGAYSPVPLLDAALMERVKHEILEPTLRGLQAEGLDFRGCLYVGLMLGPQGPKVVEYNARFGDPETQVLLPRMDFDLAEVLGDVAAGNLDAAKLKWKPEAAVCVVLASKGYPGAPEKGKRISGLEEAARLPETILFHSGTKKVDGAYENSGGRVLGVTALAPSLAEAMQRAYAAVAKIRFEGMQYRLDIAQKALVRQS
jgi:phosphoribosylamine--glycine ligase